jgi:hypothetical protein
MEHHGTSPGTPRRRPGDTAEFREDVARDVADDVIEAVGKASEALEYIERARGHLYTFHQLLGRADLLFGEAAEMLAEAGQPEESDRVERDVVGRNVLDGRWTFQIVEEFDALYYDAIVGAVRHLEERFQDGRRHVYEARMKEDRRSSGRAGHEHRPRDAHDRRVETDSSRSS